MQLEPIVSFAILLAVILIIPLCFEKLRLPGLLGLLLAGVALGPNGLQLLRSESETMQLLSDIGLVYLLFVAGLEVDLEQFQSNKYKSATFGFYTFIVPLIVGTLVGRWFGFDWNASVLIGSLFASHTLLAYPIISRLGVVNNEAVIVTIGATIFTDVGALLVLAVCIGINEGNFNAFKLISLLLGLLIYSAFILFGFSWLGQEFFRRSGEEEGNQFLFVLLVVFVSALGAELIGVEKIVGAFLAGLAVNNVTGDGPVKEKILFVGSVLFIPIFFVDIGLLIDLPAFVRSIGAIWLTLTVLIGLIGSKFLAALFAKLTFRYSWRECITMWSLSMPQVAATLAATFVGYRAGMLTEDLLNSVIVLMLATSTLGPLITSRSAVGLRNTVVTTEAFPLSDWGNDAEQQPPTIVVPVYNPRTEQYLIEMAALLARRGLGKIVPLSITVGRMHHLDAPEIEGAMQRGQKLLTRATELSREFGVEAEPLLRIDDGIAEGISRASREKNASLVIMGLGKAGGLRARLFGNVIDRVLWASHCPVAVSRLLDSPATFQRILVPIEELSQQAASMIYFAEILAAANQAEVTLMHVSDRRSSAEWLDWARSRLELLVSECAPKVMPEIRIVTADDVAAAIVDAAQSFDLVVLRTLRRRINVGELAISDVTTRIMQQVKCSVVTLGEPQRHHTALMMHRNL